MSTATKSVNELTGEVTHLTGCPAKRIEVYDETEIRSVEGERRFRPVTVYRCCDCGNYEIKERGN